MINGDVPPGSSDRCVWCTFLCAGDGVAATGAVLQADLAGEKKSEELPSQILGSSNILRDINRRAQSVPLSGTLGK